VMAAAIELREITVADPIDGAFDSAPHGEACRWTGRWEARRGFAFRREGVIIVLEHCASFGAEAGRRQFACAQASDHAKANDGTAIAVHGEAPFGATAFASLLDRVVWTERLSTPAWEGERRSHCGWPFSPCAINSSRSLRPS
jgi:hypothetical protein